MEEAVGLILELLWQVFGEILLQVAAELLAEFGQRKVADLIRPEDKGGEAKPIRSPVSRFIGCVVWGTVFGFLSLTLFRSHFIASPPWRWGNLIATPVLAGVLMAWIGARRNRRGQRVVALDQFANGWAFAVAFALVRLLACR